MRFATLLVLLPLLFPRPALAEADTAVAYLTEGYAGFATATAALSQATEADCTPATLQPAFNAAYDAWLRVAFFHLGPVEKDGRALVIAFWPDPKGLGAKAQRALLTGDPALLAPDHFAEQSVAARGLTGLERLLYGTPDADPCALIRATSADLHRMAAGVVADWPGFAGSLTSGGAAGNTAYLSQAEALQALFTQAATGLEFVADGRIGRPLGTFDKPRPERAEARASSRSSRNIALTLRAVRDFAVALHGDLPRSTVALDLAIAQAEALDNPDLSGITDPQDWLKLQILQQSVRAARDSLIAELAPALGVGLGFNSQDGD